MGDVNEVPEFLLRLRERRAAREQTNTLHDPDLIPEVSPSSEYQPTEADQEIDNLLQGVDVLEAYRRWCGKMEPRVGSKRESIMISCPWPTHPDEKESASVNLDKDVFACHAGCPGGDKYVIAAIHFGYGEDYQRHFPELKRKMVESMGYVLKKSRAGQEYVDKQVTEEPEPEVESVPGTVVPLFAVDENTIDEQIRIQDIRIDWEEIVPRETFLWEWMTATTIDDLPHEYYFWLGLQAIAFAAGTDQLLYDFQMVKPNLFIIQYGGTGSGKTRSLAPYIELLETALPYDEDPYNASTGTKILSSPASAEALLRMFSKEIIDPSTNQTIERVQVRGLLRVEEFASFVARASRATNPMKETLIELYDVLGRDMKHTSVSGGTIVAKEPFCQMVTTTQPQAIHDFLRRTDAHSGFLNRWVFAAGTRRRSRISYGGANIDVSSASNYLRNLKIFCSTPNNMVLQGTALDTWDGFFHQEIVPLHDNSNESMYSRIDLTLKKIILLFTLNEHQTQPTADIVRRSVMLYDYLRRTYTMFSKDIAHNEHEECRLFLRELIIGYEKKHSKPPTLRDVVMRLNNKFDRHMVDQVIKTMINLDELEEVIVKSVRGPSTKRYHYAAI